MPYVPTDAEAERLARAIDMARFSEGERVFWLTAFVTLVAFDVYTITAGLTMASLVGSVGSLFALYWRLRGVHLAGKVKGHRGLYGLSLMTREQRAFTGLMLRHAFTGRNPMRPRQDHDPFKDWGKVVERMQAGEEA